MPGAWLWAMTARGYPSLLRSAGASSHRLLVDRSASEQSRELSLLAERTPELDIGG